MKNSIRNEIAKCQLVSLRKKIFHTSLFMYFAFILSEHITIISSKKCAITISFRKYERKGVLHVIYLLNYNSSKSTLFMLNMTSDVFLSRLLSNKLEFFVSCNTKITITSFLLLSLCVFWYVLFYKNSIVKILFCSVLTSIWNAHFQQNVNDEEMITSHFMCDLHYKTVWEKKNYIY